MDRLIAFVVLELSHGANEALVSGELVIEQIYFEDQLQGK